ncbi:PREDICTED: vesicle-associated protein 2-1-like isoform X2 [Tarenaya hassleriana]|uniref:vesicle-associated protein 2-1-like isoform X2 n=1 Tax=Tarenaya hassleriana TaxID=28532 RepID=UPI00053C288C|nr:PREDICTED: vesicle-associated protein 2-1-like isoform X2 [Tarenaya hassleriana]
MNSNSFACTDDHKIHRIMSVELEKQSYCDLKIANKTEHYVAFKVKTTSPKKYFVRPNTGVVQPWDSCIIRVTLQAQREHSPDMHCKDKFLLQSTIVPPHTDVDELPQDTFTKDGGKTLEECKLKVSYVSPSSPHESCENTTTKGDGHGSETISTIHRLKEERDAAVKLMQQLQQELETLRRRKSQKSDAGFTLKLAAIVGLVGIIIGYILKFTFSSPPETI